MFERTTRLEFVIVVAALLVLLFCSRPPTSGNADIYIDPGRTPEEPRLVAPRPDSDALPVPSESSAIEDESSPVPGADAEPATSDTTPPPTKRIAVVDARNSGNLNYKDVMYGEVKVRWVWNGTKLVPRKVCEVKEANGVISVWSFDDHENILLSELPPGQTRESGSSIEDN